METPKYPAELVKRIAEEVGMGLICFLNTDTHEVESVLGEGYNAYLEDDDSYRDVYDKVAGWEHSVRIEPPESWESFKIMEDFIGSCIPDGEPVGRSLSEALARRKPFQHFKFVIDGSKYRQQWFDYKQSRLEEFVLEQIIPVRDFE